MSETTIDSMMGALQRLKDVRSYPFHFGEIGTDIDYCSGWLSVAVSSSCKRSESDLNKPIRLWVLHR